MTSNFLYLGLSTYGYEAGQCSIHIEQLVPIWFMFLQMFSERTDLITDAVYHEMIFFHLCLSPKLFSCG